ncbi:DUF642 domain-containing protein [Alteromonas facilis]|uniref:DUF642 domain-containing protein n=1 Tax=Alteromonas facilis TaxID=2048004 RepID=UPI000C29529A|nr:DUF642 domain-containing protein [Alteromonas facilis]
MLKKLVATAVLMLTALGAQANLISNGSFEDNNVNPNSWRWFYSSDVNGWSGSNIEIWDDFLGVKAVDGSQFAELNAHANNGQRFSIQQSFATDIGSIYNLSFFYSARRSNDEAFEVSLANGNTSFFQQVMADHVVGSWSFFNTSFKAVSNTTTLFFSTINPWAGTYGNFIDNVIVTGAPSQSQAVSEPPAIALAAIFAVLLVLRLKKRQVNR